MLGNTDKSARNVEVQKLMEVPVLASGENDQKVIFSRR